MNRFKNSGFSLIELMIAMLITSFVIIGVYQIIRSQAKTSGEQVQASSQLRNSQRARLIISNDIAQAGYDAKAGTTGHVDVEAISAATDDSITVQGDFDQNGTIDNPAAAGAQAEVIRYSFSGGNKQLVRTTNNTDSAFLTGVESFQLTYLNSAGTALTATDLSSATGRLNIKQVRISWTLETSSNKTGVSQRTEKQEFLVNLRNYRGS